MNDYRNDILRTLTKTVLLDEAGQPTDTLLSITDFCVRLAATETWGSELQNSATSYLANTARSTVGQWMTPGECELLFGLDPDEVDMTLWDENEARQAALRLRRDGIGPATA